MPRYGFFGLVIPGYAVFIFLMLAVMGIVVWFTWQQVESGSTGDQWSYSTLIANAQTGKVARVDIAGGHAVATERGTNAKHDVTLTTVDDKQTLASELIKDNVDFSCCFQSAGSYRSPGDGAYVVSVLVPNVVLLVLVGGFMFYAFHRLTRRAGRDAGHVLRTGSNPTERDQRGS